MSFIETSRELLANLAEAVFSELSSGETLNLSLSAEDQVYVRFNGPRVRQASGVQQSHLSLGFQALGRKIAYSVDLSGDTAVDGQILRSLVERARAESRVLPEDPFLVPMANHGSSENHHAGQIPGAEELIEAVAENAEGTDFSGFLAAGPQIRANCNSLGQSHWFSTESFFVDYSFFTVNASGENKAVKGLHAGRHFDRTALAASFADRRAQLEPLRRESRNLQPGAFRVYLAPAAVADFIDMFSWGAVSYGAWKRGNSAFKKLVAGEARLSPQFSLKENFALGLTPAFNSLGEISPEQLPIITGGALNTLLISSRSAREYGVTANGAEPEGWSGEFLRSPDLAPGALPEAEVLTALDTGIYIGNLHYLNWSDVQSARLTGMTRYACFWVENGEVVAPIKDMRFDESLYHVFGSELEQLTQETHVHASVDTYGHRSLGGSRTPGALVGKFRFAL